MFFSKLLTKRLILLYLAVWACSCVNNQYVFNEFFRDVGPNGVAPGPPGLPPETASYKKVVSITGTSIVVASHQGNDRVSCKRIF